MCKQKAQILLNRILIFVLIVNYCYYRTCIATTNGELVFYGFITAISVVFLLANVGLYLMAVTEKTRFNK